MLTTYIEGGKYGKERGEIESPGNGDLERWRRTFPQQLCTPERGKDGWG